MPMLGEYVVEEEVESESVSEEQEDFGFSITTNGIFVVRENYINFVVSPSLPLMPSKSLQSEDPQTL